MIIKFLDKDFQQLKFGVDVTNELSSINIKNSMYNGSSIEIKTPITKNSREWFENIRETILSNDGNSFTAIANTKNIQDYFIIDSITLEDNRNEGKSNMSIIGYSMDRLLQTRLAPEKTYTDMELQDILEDLIKGSGLGGVNDETYPYDIGDGNREARYVPTSDLEIDITSVGLITYEVSNQTVGELVSELLKQYGKRMYSIYDELSKKLVIIIEDGADKTFASTGLKNLISSSNENITSLSYRIDRNERINFLVANEGEDVLTAYDGSTENNPAVGINRRESFVSQTSFDSDEAKQQSIENQFRSSEDSLEKINVSGQLEQTFDYGLNSNQIFVGDYISVAVYDESGTRYVIDDILSEINIIIDNSKGANLTPTYIPTIGIDDTDDDGNYITRRQKLSILSAKDVARK